MNFYSKYTQIKDITWCCISVFYSKESFNTLLSSINTFYYENKDKLDFCFIYFSETQGEHLDIIFTSTFQDKEYIYHHINDYLLDFIKRNPSITNNTFPYGNKIWMDYPNNSIAWNKFHIPRIIINEKRYLSFSHLTSLLIFYLYDDQYEHDENIFNLATYFSVKLAKYSPQNNIDAHLNISINESYIKATNKENINTLEIIDSYWNFEFEDIDMHNLFVTWVNNVKSIYQKEGYVKGFEKMTSSIYFQLNINNKLIRTIIDLIKVRNL